MKLTAKLAYSQLKVSRRRTVWTLLGIVLSSAMITAVCGFVASGDAMIKDIKGHYYDRAAFMTSLISLGLILGAIVAAVSVIVISNAFRVSAGERITQFGILKSVGATKRQIAATVMYEGVWLSVIGIPVGVALGIAVNFAGIGIANYLLTGLNRLNSNADVQLVLRFVLHWLALVIAAAGSFLTVMLSAWLPARKAAKIAAIDAIRGAGSIKVKDKRVRANWFVQKLFGFEGALASKSLKRSRRNFRATVISLTISVVLYMAASSVGAFGLSVTGEYYPGLDMTVLGAYSSSVTFNYFDGGLSERLIFPLDKADAEEITARFREYPDTSVYGIGGDNIRYSVALPADMATTKMREVWGGEFDNFGVALVSADAENYARLCRKAGVPLGSNILVNSRRSVVDGVRTVFEPFVFRRQTLHLQDVHDLSKPIDLPLHGELTVGEVPEEIMLMAGYGIAVIVPECDLIHYSWIVSAADADGFTEYANAIINEKIPPNDMVNVRVENIAEATGAIRDFRNLLLTFIYGFVGMLILVGLTNVISTISTNVRSRSREFALLHSAGMTDGGVKRMLNLESVLSSARALFFGLPLGCAISYLMYLGTINTVDFPYKFPWLTIVQCVLGVFVITWATMRFAASRLRGGSIVAAIRSENGI